jgi:ABC-type glycerol-3-phosphate transport system substrate-binding protein
VKKSSASAVAVAALLVTTLAGCGLGPSASGGGDSRSVAGPVKGQITFSTLQLKPTFTDYITGVISDFERKYPGTSVKWIDVPFQGAQEKIATDAQAGTLPDVINLNPNFAQPLEKAGAFVDLEAALPGIKSTYVAGAWDAFSVPGRPGSFGFPWYLSSEVTMYNTAMFAKAGLDPTRPPTTYTQLFSDAKALSKANAGFTGMHPALENRFITDLGRLGVPLMNKAGTKWTFNTPAAKSYVEQLVELYKTGVFPPDSLTQDHGKETEAYQAGQIALFPSGANFLTIIEQNAPQIAEATDVGPQITSKGGPTNVSVMGLLVPKSSKNKATAAKFAQYITNAANQLEFAKIVTIFPSATKALADPYFTDDSDGSVDSKARRIAANQLKEAKNIVPVQFDDRVKAAVIGKIQLAMKGELTPQEALDQAVAAANAITAK